MRARSYFNTALVGAGQGTLVVAAPAAPEVVAPPPAPVAPAPPLAAMPPAEAVPAAELKRSGNGAAGTVEHAPPAARCPAAPRHRAAGTARRTPGDTARRGPANAGVTSFVLPQSGPPPAPPSGRPRRSRHPWSRRPPQVGATGALSGPETLAPPRPAPVPPAATPPSFVLPATPPAAPKSAPPAASALGAAPVPAPPAAPAATTVAETPVAGPGPTVTQFRAGGHSGARCRRQRRTGDRAGEGGAALPRDQSLCPPAPKPPAITSEDKLGQVGFAPPPPPRRSDPVEVKLTPGAAVAYLGGAPVEMVARIRNVGTDVDQYNMESATSISAWYTVDAQSMSLFPGDTQAIPIEIDIPDGARPGEHRFMVRATSVFDARETNTASGKLDVLLKQAPVAEPPPRPVASPPVPTGAAQPAGTLGVAPASEFVRVTLNPATVEIAAGGPPVEISAAIRNPNPSITDFSLEVENLDRSWYSLSAPRVAVYPGDSAAIRIQLHPPATGDTRPGEYSFVVRARAVGNPALVGVTGGAMRVLPPVQRAPEVITITPAANWQATASNPSTAAPAGPAAGSGGRAAPAQPEAPLELVRVTLNPAQTKAIAGAAPGVVVVNVQNASSTPEQYTVEVEDLEGILVHGGRAHGRRRARRDDACGDEAPAATGRPLRPLYLCCARPLHGQSHGRRGGAWPATATDARRVPGRIDAAAVHRPARQV